MSGSTNKAEHELLQAGALVEFRILDTHTELSPDGENISIHVDIILGGDDDDVEPADVAEWGTFGFLFVMVCSRFMMHGPEVYRKAIFYPMTSLPYVTSSNA